MQNKPIQGSTYDRFHPQNAGCKLWYAFNEGGGTPVDLVTGIPLTVVGTPSPIWTPDGQGRFGYGTAKYDAIDPDVQVIGGGIYPEYFAVAVVSSATSKLTVVSIGNSAGGFNQIAMNASGAGSLTYNGAGVNAGTSGLPTSDGILHVIAAVSRSANQHELWWDGVIVATSSASKSSAIMPYHTLGVLRYSSINYAFFGSIYWHKAGNGAVPDIAELARNPYAGILAPSTKKIFDFGSTLLIFNGSTLINSSSSINKISGIKKLSGYSNNIYSSSLFSSNSNKKIFKSINGIGTSSISYIGSIKRVKSQANAISNTASTNPIISTKRIKSSANLVSSTTSTSFSSKKVLFGKSNPISGTSSTSVLLSKRISAIVNQISSNTSFNDILSILNLGIISIYSSVNTISATTSLPETQSYKVLSATSKLLSSSQIQNIPSNKRLIGISSITSTSESSLISSVKRIFGNSDILNSSYIAIGATNRKFSPVNPISSQSVFERILSNSSTITSLYSSIYPIESSFSVFPIVAMNNIARFDPFNFILTMNSKNEFTLTRGN